MELQAELDSVIMLTEALAEKLDCQMGELHEMSDAMNHRLIRTAEIVFATVIAIFCLYVVTIFIFLETTMRIGVGGGGE